jgi:hypothetical protein
LFLRLPDGGRVTPPPTPKPKRHQSQTERDIAGLAAKREREAAPAFIEEELTGQYEGEELAEMRATRRPMPTRISRLEQKHDDLAKSVGETREIVAEMSGKLDVLPSLVDAVKGMAERASTREHVTFTAQVDVDKARQLDSIDASKGKRDLYLKVAGVLLTGGLLGKLLQMAGIL